MILSIKGTEVNYVSLMLTKSYMSFFRAGAVEQLRTHVRRLNSLYPTADQGSGKPVVELYEKGYGKDAAGMIKIDKNRSSYT